jgi:META domain-containing protein
VRDARTFVAVGGVLALAAVGALAATLAGGGSGGHGSANGSVPVDDLAVLDGAWTVVGDASAPARVQGVVRLVFGEGRVLAETGCNTVRGQVLVEDSVLLGAGPLMSTRMACEPALMEQERWVTEMLGGRPRLERSGPYLYLHWGAGEQWWLGLEREPAGTSATVPAS